MSGNYCKYCNRYFRFKDLYEQHTLTCEYFYKKHRDKDRENDVIEQLPSSQQQFKLIQEMYSKIISLEKEVKKLKQNNIVKKKKMILDFLNSESCAKPNLNFQNWVSSLQPTFENLHTTFDYDLIDGITQVFKGTFNTTVLPITCFSQKPGIFYIYTDRPSIGLGWRILTNDEFKLMIQKISHKFLQLFLQWQLENHDLLQSSNHWKDKNIEYMQKINGMGHVYEQRRLQDCKKWLFQNLNQDFCANIVYDIE